MVQKNAKLSRRNFLLTVGAGGAATAAAVMAGGKALQGTSAASDKKGSRGYHETAHVNNYYRTAKV
jgi:alkyl hydroperoxide reductase subunit AhpF